MSKTPINIFQQLMRKWDARHPYNAAQVLKIRGTADHSAFTEAWKEMLAITGLGRAVFSADHYHFAGGSSTANVVSPTMPFAEHISLEMNRTFAEDELPLRPFLIQEGDSFYAGVTYQHWIADSVSIRMLLREWFTRVYDPAAARSTRFNFPDRGYWQSIGPARGGWELTESVLGLIRRHTRLRRAQKIHSQALSDHQTQFQVLAAPEGLISQLKHYANDHSVKLNDIFLAALLETCAQNVPLQPRPNRTDVAVGSVVDLRPFCPEDLSQTFGVYLGFTNVVARPTDIADFQKLLHVISNQTRLQKATGVAPASLMWMGAAVAIGRFSGPDELYHFYRKELPLAGGLSNVDLSKSWAAAYHPALLLDYIRISPTGPLGPVTLTTTTLKDQFNIGLTHRSGPIPPDLAGRIGKSFIARLSHLK